MAGRAERDYGRTIGGRVPRGSQGVADTRTSLGAGYRWGGRLWHQQRPAGALDAPGDTSRRPPCSPPAGWPGWGWRGWVWSLRLHQRRRKPPALVAAPWSPPAAGSAGTASTWRAMAPRREQVLTARAA